MQLKINKLQSIISKENTVIGYANDLGVSRQSIHKWLNKYKRFGDTGLLERKRIGCKKAHNRTSPEIKQLVIQCA